MVLVILALKNLSSPTPMMENPIAQHAVEAFNYLNNRVPTPLKAPKIAIICGSGLGGLADVVQSHSAWEISYEKIPHFPQGQGGSRCSESSHPG